MSSLIFYILLVFVLNQSFVERAWPQDNKVYLPVRSVPQVLEPSKLKLATDNFIFRQVAEGLFVVGEGFQIDPRLAQSAEWNADRTKLTIRLGEVRFSDDTLLDAPLVLKSIERCVRSSSKILLLALQAIRGVPEFISNHSEHLTGVQILDPHTLVLQLTRPAPLIFDDLAQAECHILKPSSSGSWDLLHGALGSGPYLINSANVSQLNLIRRRSYRTALHGPDQAIFRKTDSFGNFDAIKSWVTMATTDRKPENADGFRMIEFSDLGTHQLVFNNARPPFNQRDLRRAVALSMDYATFAEKLDWNKDRLQAGLVPFGMRGFRARTENLSSSAIQEAQRLLKKHGFSKEHPFEFEIVIPNMPDFEKEAKAWSVAFPGTAIRVRVRVLPYSETTALNSRGEFEAIRVTKFAGSIEPHRLLSSYITGSDYNSARSREQKCDDLLRRAMTTANQDSRFHAYEEADRCLIDRAILIPLSSFQPGFVLLKKPWKLKRTNRYLLYPYWVSEWSRDEE